MSTYTDVTPHVHQPKVITWRAGKLRNYFPTVGEADRKSGPCFPLCAERNEARWDATAESNEKEQGAVFGGAKGARECRTAVGATQRRPRTYDLSRDRTATENFTGDGHNVRGAVVIPVCHEDPLNATR